MFIKLKNKQQERKHHQVMAASCPPPGRSANQKARPGGASEERKVTEKQKQLKKERAENWITSLTSCSIMTTQSNRSFPGSPWWAVQNRVLVPDDRIQMDWEHQRSERAGDDEPSEPDQFLGSVGGKSSFSLPTSSSVVLFLTQNLWMDQNRWGDWSPGELRPRLTLFFSLHSWKAAHHFQEHLDLMGPFTWDQVTPDSTWTLVKQLRETPSIMGNKLKSIWLFIYEKTWRLIKLQSVYSVN